MSWNRVRAWREALRAEDPTSLETGLSPEGAREAWAAALEALTDEALDEVAAIPGRAFPSAAFVAAGTVVTAPIEWCAVLLGRGTRVTLKHPHDAPGLAPILAGAAAAVGLPLTITGDRAVIGEADLVVAMGSDESIAAIRAAIAPRARWLPHGHRFSAAWVTSEWDALAADAALHDGRGCLSPIVAFSPAPDAIDQLAAAMERAQARWPVGEVAPAESAAIRGRRALAKVTGEAREGAGWSVHRIPAGRWSPVALPRSIALITAATPEEAASALLPHGRYLSTVGTDEASAAPAFEAAGATRICRVGRMQRPPLIRSHDGEDWVRATLIAVSRELPPDFAR